ncbi:MAG: TolC family protein [Bacteroidota bacterium]
MRTWLILALIIICGGTALGEFAPPMELDLRTAAGSAVAVDPQVLTAQASVAAAEAGVAQELAKIAPGCTITAEHAQGPVTVGGVVETRRTSTIAFSIAQNRTGLLPRLIGGTAASEVERALWDRADAEARLAQAKVAAAAAAVQKYLAAVKADQVVRLRASAMELAKDDERVARANLAAGTVTKLDVLKAESNRERAALDLREAEANRRLAFDGLLLQIGRPLGSELVLAPVTMAPPVIPFDEQQLYEAALKQRADAIVARTALRKAERTLVLRKNASLPDLQLSATERQGDYAIDVVLDLTTGDVRWELGGQAGDRNSPSGSLTQADGLRLGLKLTWQPFDGGLTRAQVAAAQTGVESAEVSLSRVEKEIRLELRQCLSDLNLAALRLAQARRERELTSQARELAALRYREGVALFSELGEATQALTQAEFGVAQAEYDLLMARVRLDQACGQMPELKTS